MKSQPSLPLPERTKKDSGFLFGIIFALGTLVALLPSPVFALGEFLHVSGNSSPATTVVDNYKCPTTSGGRYAQIYQADGTYIAYLGARSPCEDYGDLPYSLSPYVSADTEYRVVEFDFDGVNTPCYTLDYGACSTGQEDLVDFCVGTCGSTPTPVPDVVEWDTLTTASKSVEVLRAIAMSLSMLVFLGAVAFGVYYFRR